MTETYGPITKGYRMAEWDSLEDSERYARMARQGHGFLTSLPIRVVKTRSGDGDDGGEGDGSGKSGSEDVLVDVARNGTEIGEIFFFGNICAAGYYKDPAATRKLFVGGGLRSGDLAVWHPDGSAQILDRAKDIIISGKLAPASPSPPSILRLSPACQFLTQRKINHGQAEKTSRRSRSRPS